MNRSSMRVTDREEEENNKLGSLLFTKALRQMGGRARIQPAARWMTDLKKKKRDESGV